MNGLKILLAFAVTSLGSGCLYTSLRSPVEEHWGQAYETILAEQTVDRGLPTEVAPEGLDGETARRVGRRFYKAYERTQQRRIPTVLIGDIN